MLVNYCVLHILYEEFKVGVSIRLTGWFSHPLVQYNAYCELALFKGTH